MISLKLMRNLCKYYSSSSSSSVCIYSSKNFLKPTSVYLLNKISIHREVNERAQAKLREEDNLPDSCYLIYRAPLKTFIKVTYYAAFTSIAVVFPLIATSLYANSFTQFPAMLYDRVIIGSFNELIGIVGALTFVILQVGSVVSRYPLRIYKDTESKKYIAVYQDIFPWNNKNEEFCAGELYKYEKSIMPWKECMYAFRKRKAIIMYDHLRRPADLDEMLQKDKKVEIKNKKIKFD